MTRHLIVIILWFTVGGLGLWFRRWRRPPKPKPLSRTELVRRGYSPQQQVSDAEFRELMAEMDREVKR